MIPQIGPGMKPLVAAILRHVPHVCGGFSHGHFGAYSLSAVGTAVLLQLCSAQHTAGKSTMMWSRCVAADQRARLRKNRLAVADASLLQAFWRPRSSRARLTRLPNSFSWTAQILAKNAIGSNER